LDGLAVHTVHIHSSRVEPHPNRRILLAVASRDYKQYGVETGTASINKKTCLVAKKTNT